MKCRNYEPDTQVAERPERILHQLRWSGFSWGFSKMVSPRTTTVSEPGFATIFDMRTHLLQRISCLGAGLRVTAWDLGAGVQGPTCLAQGLKFRGAPTLEEGVELPQKGSVPSVYLEAGFASLQADSIRAANDDSDLPFHLIGKGVPGVGELHDHLHLGTKKPDKSHSRPTVIQIYFLGDRHI